MKIPFSTCHWYYDTMYHFQIFNYVKEPHMLAEIHNLCPIIWKYQHRISIYLI